MQIPGANWRPMPFEEALETYAIDPDDIESLTDGEPAEHAMVHHGDLVVDGPCPIQGEDYTLFVIDGDLIVNGGFGFSSADVYTTLVVTGSLTARGLSCLWDTLLIVGRSVRVDEVLLTYITDAGVFSVKGSVSAGAWIAADDRGQVDFGHTPKARLLTRSGATTDHYGNPHYFGADAEVDSAVDEVLPEFVNDGHLLTDRIHEAVLAGRPILR